MMSSTSAATAAPAGGNGLSAAEQAQLMSQLLSELRALCEGTGAPAATPPAVLSKLALALSIMAAKSPSGPADLLASLAPLAQAPFPSPQWLVLLELLAALGEEVTRVKLGYSTAEDVKSQLRRQADAVGASLARALREAHALQVTVQPQSPQQQQLDSLVAKALAVAISWRDFGLSLTQLHSSGILSAVVHLAAEWVAVPLAQAALATTKLALLGQAIELLERALEETSYPRPAGRDAATDVIVGLLVQVCAGVYERTVSECVRLRSSSASFSAAENDLLERADQLCLYICRLSSAVGEAEMDYLACNAGSDEFTALTPGGTNHIGAPLSPNPTSSSPSVSSSSPSPQRDQLHLGFFQLHLELSAHPYHRVLVELSLDTWTVLQDMPVAERKFAWLKGDCFLRLLDVLVRQMAYPAAFRAWGQPFAPQRAQPSASAAGADAAQFAAEQYWIATFSDDPDAFLRFRAILLETLIAIHALLGPRYVERLRGALEVATQASSTAGQTASTSPQWHRVEAILSALLAIAPELHESFSANEEESDLPPEVKSQLVGQLHSILHSLWPLSPPVPSPGASPEDTLARLAAFGQNPASPPPLLLNSACAFLKSFAFLGEILPPPEAQQNLERSVAFLIASVPYTQAAPIPRSSSSGESKRGPRSGGSGSLAYTSAQGFLSDQHNVAGVAWKFLCAPSPVNPVPNCSSSMLIRSPRLLGEVVRLLFNAPGFSSVLSGEMKALWVEGLANLVSAIAYSETSVSQVRAQIRGGAPSSDMHLASGYLAEISNPILSALGKVLGHVSAQQQQGGAPQGQVWTPPPAELDAIKNELYAQLSLLLAVLEQLSQPPSPSSLQARAQLVDIAIDVPSPPSSVALSVFSSAWGWLQQATGFLLPLRESDTLSIIVRIHATSFTLLYPPELVPLLPTLLQSVLGMYKSLPLPAVLDLLEKAVATHTFGGDPDLRDQWNAVLNTVYRSTMSHTKTERDFRSHSDLFDSFFPLMSSILEHATVAFVTNPSNTFPHLIQLCVAVLDSYSQTRSTMHKCLGFLEKSLTCRAAIDILPDPAQRAELHTLYEGVWSEQGSGLLRQLVSNLTDGEMELPALLDGKVASVLYAAAQRFPDQAQGWISKALMSEYVGSGIPHVSEQDKMTFLSLLWPHRSNPHMWKSLWIDFGKVCHKRESMENLLAYQVQPSGKLRGSALQDAAFAGL